MPGVHQSASPRRRTRMVASCVAVMATSLAAGDAGMAQSTGDFALARYRAR
jgi:hypothetical protein